MKKTILYLIPFLIISCHSKSPEVDRFSPSSFNGNKKYSNKTLIEEKFQEFYDLNALLIKFPDFKDDIENRISNFTTNTKKIFDLTDSIKIKNIRQEGELIKISDSVQMTKVLFDIVLENSVKTDSVLAFITQKKIVIDSEEITSTKVKFTKELKIKKF